MRFPFYFLFSIFSLYVFYLSGGEAGTDAAAMDCWPYVVGGIGSVDNLDPASLHLDTNVVFRETG